MPLHRRIPKRGFHNLFRVEFLTVNVDRLNRFPAGTEVTPELLHEVGLLKKGGADVKILGNGALNVALVVRAHRFTESAIQKIEAAGGKAQPIVATAA